MPAGSPATAPALEANSLEAAVLKCDPSNLLGSKEMAAGSPGGVSDPAASWRDASDEDLPLDLPLSLGDPGPIQIASKEW